MSNNLPEIGNGPTGATSTGSSHFGVIVAGHSSAVAAEQINKTETYRTLTALLTSSEVCISWT